MPYTLVNRIGQRNKKIVVVECLEPSKGMSNCGGLWKCQCDCGNTKIVKGYQIINIDSCGCAVTERIENLSKTLRKYDQATINYQYSVHLQSAKAKNFQPLSKEIWSKIVFLPCFYCGRFEKRNAYGSNRYKKKLITVSQEEIDRYTLNMSGVDRIDPSQGYIENNCVPCCYKCNCMKRDYPLANFLDRIKHVYENMHLESSE